MRKPLCLQSSAVWSILEPLLGCESQCGLAQLNKREKCLLFITVVELCIIFIFYCSHFSMYCCNDWHALQTTPTSGESSISTTVLGSLAFTSICWNFYRISEVTAIIFFTLPEPLHGLVYRLFSLLASFRASYEKKTPLNKLVLL